MTNKCLVLVALLWAGCDCPDSPYPKEPNQEGAIALIWDIFNAKQCPPPVEWRSDRCPFDDSKTAVVYQGICYSGLYIEGDRAIVARRESLAESALVIELGHAWQWERGITDANHTIKEDWALAEYAREKLFERNY
jgi:hypothetical protein